MKGMFLSHNRSVGPPSSCHLISEDSVYCKQTLQFFTAPDSSCPKPCLRRVYVACLPIQHTELLVSLNKCFHCSRDRIGLPDLVAKRELREKATPPINQQRPASPNRTELPLDLHQVCCNRYACQFHRDPKHALTVGETCEPAKIHAEQAAVVVVLTPGVSSSLAPCHPTSGLLRSRLSVSAGSRGSFWAWLKPVTVGGISRFSMFEGQQCYGVSSSS